MPMYWLTMLMIMTFILITMITLFYFFFLPLNLVNSKNNLKSAPTSFTHYLFWNWKW